MPEGSPEGNPSEGSALRKQLEETLAANKALKETLVGSTVANFKYVKPEDLADVAPDQLASRAAEIEQQRADEQNQLVRQTLIDKGLDEKQVEAILAGQAQEAKPAQPQSQVASLGRLQAPAPGAPKDQSLYGPSKLRAAFAGQS